MAMHHQFPGPVPSGHVAYTFLYVSPQEDTVKTMSYSESRARYAEVLDSVVDDCEEVVILPKIGRASCRERV